MRERGGARRLSEKTHWAESSVSLLLLGLSSSLVAFYVARATGNHSPLQLTLMVGKYFRAGNGKRVLYGCSSSRFAHAWNSPSQFFFLHFEPYDSSVYLFEFQAGKAATRLRTRTRVLCEILYISKTSERIYIGLEASRSYILLP